MKVEYIKIQNFKTFKNASVQLNDFNVLIGANASGKSSFLQLFKFLKDIKSQGLENAISLQGGIDYLRNFNLGPSLPLSIEIKIGLPKVPSYLSALMSNQNYEFYAHKFVYKFTLDFFKKGRGYKIIEDYANFDISLVPLDEKGSNIKDESKVKAGSLSFNLKDGKIKLEQQFPEGIDFSKKVNEFPVFVFSRDNQKRLLLETPYFLFPIIDDDLLNNINLYDIDPKLPKRAVPLSAKADLEFDGSNLAIVLKNLVSDPKKKIRFTNLITDLLPFVGDIRVESIADKSFLFKVQEQYSSNTYLPASLLSDGTIGVTALLIALFFERSDGLSIIEEPERNIHPSLISKIISMMKDVSLKKQLFITTHNLEVIKNTDINDILLISRSDDGFSNIQRPSEIEHVKVFLEKELGIEDLYLQNLL